MPQQLFRLLDSIGIATGAYSIAGLITVVPVIVYYVDVASVN